MPAEIIALSDGRIRIPGAGNEQPPGSYGFPPALIPMWSQGSGPTYWGLWRHWFVAREPVFVKMSVEAEHSVLEFARTPAQLYRRLVLSEICLRDAVTSEVELFADELGIRGELEALDQITLATGDDPRGLTALADFAENPPASCVSDSPERYVGEFVLEGAPCTAQQLKLISPFELPAGFSAPLTCAGELPPWFAPVDKFRLFSDFHDHGDLGSAWLALNSPGWSFSQAKAALARLAAQQLDPAIRQFADAWLAEPSDRFGGY